MENPESALIRLKQLHEEEVSLILNQFGIGYSSIAYLNKIPFEMIRIDQSFIKTIHEGETKVLRSLLKMADELSLVSLADNLQHPNEIRVLSELGCVYGSGPLFQESCEPLEVREMLGYH